MTVSFSGALRLAAAATAALACLASVTPARADEALLRKNFMAHNPKGGSIDEVSKTPIAGLFEVRVGTEIYYVDETGNYILFPGQGSDGHIIDMRTKTDLTEARINKLTAIDVAALPFKDAIVIKQGTGARRLVVFEDPNCGYCKQLERDLVALKDVTIYTFLMPILGPDSVTKSRDIWCAKDNGAAWRTWMLNSTLPQRSMGKCDVAALDRNTELGRKYRIQGTPAVIFDDGTRAPGAIPLEKIEARIAQAKKG